MDYVMLTDLPDVHFAIGAKLLVVTKVRDLPKGGTGKLSGSMPEGVVTVEGAPDSAEVRVLDRELSILVATTQAAPDGTWEVDNLNKDAQYDVVGRHAGYNDVIVSKVRPV